MFTRILSSIVKAPAYSVGRAELRTKLTTRAYTAPSSAVLAHATEAMGARLSQATRCSTLHRAVHLYPAQSFPQLVVRQLTTMMAPLVKSSTLRSVPSLQLVQCRNYIRRRRFDSIKLIRHRKMKKHKLKKLRKRMLFHNRKVLLRRRKKKEKIVVEMLKKYKLWGDEFSAEQFVEKELDLARKGGYKIDIFETYQAKSQATK